MWKQQARPAFLLFLILTVITGGLYPSAVTGMATLFFSGQANGSLIERKGEVAGSSLIGQSFDDPKYFWGRPSATNPFPYNSAASSGSNFGPTHSALRKAVAERIALLKAGDPENTAPVPADLVTASGSGLDPHISPAAAAYQIRRVAKKRRLEEEKIRRLLSVYTEGRLWGVLGEPRVNVLRLNLALDELTKTNKVD